MSRKKNPPTKSAKNAKPASGIGASRQTPAASKGLPQLELNDVVTKIQEMTQLVAAFRAPDSSRNNSTSLSQPGVSREWVDSAQLVLRTLLQTLLQQMKYIFTNADPVMARVALKNTCGGIIECLRAIEPPQENTSLRILVEEHIKTSYDFPCILSCFNQTSKKRYNLIMREYKLGANLPFKIAPNAKYRTATIAAIHIVSWISEHRSNPASVYRRIEPELEGKAFCAVNSSIWEKVIGFHLDYLMAPAKRTKTILLEKAQLPGEVDREVELMNWEHFCGVKGPITEYPEFKSLLSDGRDRDTKVKTEGGLYNRAKGKILEAARRLMKDNIAPGPV